MTTQPREQTVSIHTLSKKRQVEAVERSKGNQTMKFCLLIEHNMRNIFPKKSYTIYGEGTGPIIFRNNQN